jgi:hypothetical protein
MCNGAKSLLHIGLYDLDAVRGFFLLLQNSFFTSHIGQKYGIKRAGNVVSSLRFSMMKRRSWSVPHKLLSLNHTHSDTYSGVLGRSLVGVMGNVEA